MDNYKDVTTNETRQKEDLWQKIKRSHFLLMIFCCVVPVVLVLGFLALFRGSGDSWVWLFILLCPILHFWLMKKGHKHDGDRKKDDHDS